MVLGVLVSFSLGVVSSFLVRKTWFNIAYDMGQRDMKRCAHKLLERESYKEQTYAPEGELANGVSRARLLHEASLKVLDL